VKKSLLQKNFFLLCLAFVLTAVAPLRALALPSAAMSATCSMVTSQAGELKTSTSTALKSDDASGVVDVMDCCKVEKSCCCSPAPVEPGNLESGVQSNQSAKFIAIKGSARPAITDWLSSSPTELQDIGRNNLVNQALVSPQPLYILKRSLLI
jgi:hypothetical protein